MLKALYDYGVRRSLVLPAGFARKTVKAYISLLEGSDEIGLLLGDDTQIACPDIGSLANGKDKCNVVVEKRSVVIPEEPSAKSEFFLDALRSAAAYEPRLYVCVEALENSEKLERIRALLDQYKIKPSERISFRVNGRNLPQSEPIRRWWQEYRRQFVNADEKPTSLCLITGQPTVPMRTTTPIQGLGAVGGHARGDALICFDKAAFESYNQKQAANAPVSEEAFSAVKAALDDLLRDAPNLAGMKFVHWFDREIPQREDPLFSADFGFDVSDDDDEDVPEENVNEAAERRRADQVIGAVRSGEEPPDLSDVSYYILLLSGVNGRIMVRQYERGSYEQLRHNLALWRADLKLTNSVGTAPIKNVKLAARLLRLIKYQKTDQKPFERMAKELAGITPSIYHAILTGCPLPDSIAAKALAYIRSELLSNDEDGTSLSFQLPNALACQWLKVWLMRKNRNDHREVPIMGEYNVSLPNSAYHCGALMAVYAAIQKEAMRDVNVGVVERYYASAIQMPALVIGQLSSRSNYHLGKMENKWLSEKFRELLQEAATALGGVIPATLNLEQQSYFALGYYQMGAKLNREKRERIEAAKQKKEQAADVQPENN